MFIMIFTILLIIFFIINFKVYKNVINYLNVFLIMYYLVAILSSSGRYGFSIPSNTTYGYLLLALISLEVFSIFFMKIKIPIKENTNEEILNQRRLTLISVGVLILMIPTTIEGIKILSEYGFTAVRSAAFSDDVYSSYTKIFLTYILVPINKAIYIYTLLDYIKTNKVKISLIISIFNVLQTVVTLGGRSVILDLILISVVIVYEKYNRNIIKILNKNKKIIAVAVLLIFVIVLVTNDRSLNKNEGFWFNLYSYYVGSIHLFNVHIQNPSVSLLDGNHLLYGRGMLSPLWEISKITLKSLGFNVNIITGMDLLNQQVQQYLTVKNGIKMNNNVTFMYVCLRDFDIYGLIIGPAYIALCFAMLYKFYIKKKSVRTDALYFYLISNLPYFIFEFFLNKTPVILTFIFISIIYKIVYSKSNKIAKE